MYEVMSHFISHEISNRTFKWQFRILYRSGGIVRNFLLRIIVNNIGLDTRNDDERNTFQRVEQKLPIYFSISIFWLLFYLFYCCNSHRKNVTNLCRTGTTNHFFIHNVYVELWLCITIFIIWEEIHKISEFHL